MKILLKDLPKVKNLKGKKINIVRQGGKYHYDYQDIPKIRTFIRAAIKRTKNNILWVYWYWKPESEFNKYDCGYSGVALTENYKNSYLEVED